MTYYESTDQNNADANRGSATERLDLSGHLSRPLYNTKAVSVRTGVPADTFRAWERRYGMPKPYRTAEDYRLYSERDIAAICWLKQQTDRGMAIRHAVALLRESDDRAAAPIFAPDSTDEAVRTLVESVAAFDRENSEQLLAGCFRRYGVETTCLHVIQPAMYSIGTQWEAGRVSVSVEHFATQVVRSRLAMLSEAEEPAGTMGPVVTACAPGETHELGLIILGIFLIRRDVRVVHLGPDYPVDELHHLTGHTKPRVVCLSASTEENARALIKRLGTVREANGTLSRICCGGYAFRMNPDLRAQVDDLWMCIDAPEAADAIRDFVARG